jgi:predicted transcriptional regulator
MKPTTIYLPEETEANLQELANQTGKSISEIIQELVTDYFTQKPQKLPKSIGMGASGRSDLSSQTEQLLWTEE